MRRCQWAGSRHDNPTLRMAQSAQAGAAGRDATEDPTVRDALALPHAPRGVRP